MQKATPAQPSRRCVRILADRPAAERIAATLEAADWPPDAVSIFDHEPGQLEIAAYYAAEPSAEKLKQLVAAAVGREVVSGLRIEAIEPADWVTHSQTMRGPVRAGRFLVHGSHDRACVGRNACAIEIDAGQAFGTAHHASTRGCLLALDRLLKQRRPRRVVDIGTGTGILAIAAAKALRAHVLASDNDPLAVAIAAGNAQLNGVGSLLRVVRAQGLGYPSLRRRPADLIFANLLLNPLLALAPAFARGVRSNGLCLLSGLTQDQGPSVEARFVSLGFSLKSRILLHGWTTLLFTRRSTRKVRVGD
jgi:ribosomal protein L11 methyltransferase